MKLLRCNSGVSALEFGLLLPLLLLLLLGTIELGRYALINQKLDKATNAMADYVTQSAAVRFVDMDNYALAARQILRPFDFDGTIIFSAIQARAGTVPPCAGIPTPCISWQYKPVGGDASRIGTPGNEPTLPGGYVVAEGEVVIVAETYLNFQPLFVITGTLVSALANHQVYKIAIFKPRQTGSLTNPPT